MKITSTIYRRHFLKRQDSGMTEDQTIGSALRYARVMMGLTLEEAAEGICSVSYLSKLETSKIKGSKKLLDQLTERFKVRQSSSENRYQFETVLNHLLDYLLMHEPFNDQVVEPLLSYTDYQGLMCQLILAFINQDDSMFSKLFFEMDFVISTLKDYEFALLTSVVAQVLYRHGKYQQAYEVMTFIPKSFDLPYGISIIQKHIQLSCALKLNRTIDLINNYHDYLNELARMHFMALYKDMRFKFLEYEACYQKEERAIRTYASERELDAFDKTYLSIKTLYYNGQYSQVLQMIGKDYHKHQGIFAIYLMTLDLLNEKNKIKEVLTLCDRKHINCTYAQSIIKHLEMKLYGTKEEILKYLRNDIMYLKKFPEDIMLIEYLMLDCQKLFELYQYYKEANQVIHQMMPMIFNLRKAI
ncbi:MAG: hypothetical protein CVV61_00015 [Tenericutes bacterium HGW-Tenericutes-6]|jgi:transcriptional regulator with XRE-family HTH domain|nr:MAG: hypothetical protein CVV61_00015 [Tenericutes bacterium HGW-Tenericutes-6]